MNVHIVKIILKLLISSYSELVEGVKVLLLGWLSTTNIFLKLVYDIFLTIYFIYE